MSDQFPSNMEQAIRRVACRRCGREPTSQSGDRLSFDGYCIVCKSLRYEQAARALDWCVYRQASILRGTWYDADERPHEGRQARITEEP